MFRIRHLVEYFHVQQFREEHVCFSVWFCRGQTCKFNYIPFMALASYGISLIIDHTFENKMQHFFSFGFRLMNIFINFLEFYILDC